MDNLGQVFESPHVDFPEKGLAGRGWRLTNPNKTATKFSRNASPFSQGGIEKRVPEIREFVAFRDLGTFFQQLSWDLPGVLSQGEKPPKIRKKKFPGTKFLGTFGPPPTEKTEKIGKIKGTLVRKVPGNLRSQEFVFFLGRFFCPLFSSGTPEVQTQEAATAFSSFLKILSVRVRFGGVSECGWDRISEVANPFPPYSIQKSPEPQICPKFVPAIVFGGSSQGDWNLSKICQNLSENYRFSNFDKFLTNSSPLDWNPQKQSPGQILDKFGVRGAFESCKGEKGSQL